MAPRKMKVGGSIQSHFAIEISSAISSVLSALKRTFVNSIPMLLFFGVTMAFLSYILFDRFFVDISPNSYPKGVLYLISFPFKNAFADEIILRLCFLTICIGLLKKRIAAIRGWLLKKKE